MIPPACQRIVDDASTSLPFGASAPARCNLGCREDAAVAASPDGPLTTHGPLEQPVPRPWMRFPVVGAPSGAWSLPRRFPGALPGKQGLSSLNKAVNAGDLVRGA
jgi:hypothetical protein